MIFVIWKGEGTKPNQLLKPAMRPPRQFHWPELQTCTQALSVVLSGVKGRTSKSVSPMRIGMMATPPERSRHHSSTLERPGPNQGEAAGRDQKIESAPMKVRDAGMGISLAELRQAKGYETVNPVNLSRSGLQLMRALLEQRQRNQQSVQQLATWAEKLWMSQLLSCGTVMALTAGPFQGHWLVVRGGPWMVRALALEVDADGGMWKVVQGLKEIPITNEGMVKIFKVDWGWGFGGSTRLLRLPCSSLVDPQTHTNTHTHTSSNIHIPRWKSSARWRTTTTASGWHR